MSDRILSKIRRLNRVLTESTAGMFSYDELGKILSEVINANVYITDAGGNVLGAGYINAEDTSTVTDEKGGEKLTEAHNSRFMKIESTVANLRGKEATDLLGEDYTMAGKYHCVIPAFCGGERLGTLILARYSPEFDEEDIALCEYGAAVIGLEIQRNNRLAREEELRKKAAVDIALASLSFSEKEAVCNMTGEFEGDTGTIVTSKIAEKYGMTVSLTVNALRKLESAGVVETRSMGMKGTRIKILNPCLRERLK